MGGGSPAVTKTSETVNKTPYGPAAGYFPSLYQRGSELAFNAPQNYVARPTAGEMSSVNQLYGLAPTLGSAGSPMVDMARRIASGEFLDPSQNPAFAGAASAAINPLTRAFTERVLPGLTNTAIMAGGAGTGPSAFGGASLGMPQYTATQDWLTGAGDITSKMALDYSKLGAQMIPYAAELSKAGEAARLMPATVTGAAGAQERSWAQDAINNLLQRYQTQTGGLGNFANLLTQGGFGTTASQGTKTEQQAQASLLTQILQGAAGAAGVAGSMFGVPTGGTSAASNLFNLFSGGGIK